MLLKRIVDYYDPLANEAEPEQIQQFNKFADSLLELWLELREEKENLAEVCSQQL